MHGLNLPGAVPLDESILEDALAQFAATGTLNGTFYATAENQLETTLRLAQTVEPEFLDPIGGIAGEDSAGQPCPFDRPCLP